MKIKKRQFRAFTLMELILTISIMGLIAGVATPVLISSQYTSELKSDAIRVEELIKKAQNLAITGSTSANTGGVPTFGYGVNFSSTGEITIFANGLNGESYRFNDGEEYTEDGGNNQIQLSNNVGVLGFSTDDISGSLMPSSIGANMLFIPPRGGIELSDNRIGNPANSFDREMSLFLKHENKGTCYVFRLSKITDRYFKEKQLCP